MSMIGELHSVATVSLVCTEYKPVWALEPVCTLLEMRKIIVPTGYGTPYHVACARVTTPTELSWLLASVEV
jgi:hypothetical protein